MATISENLQTIADSAVAIKQAIIDKGGEITGDITTYASAIDSLPNESVSTEYNIDFPDTTENNVNVYNFLTGLLSSITCNEKRITYISMNETSIAFQSYENSAYNIILSSNGECFSTGSGGSND